MSTKIASQQAVCAVADGLKAQGEEPTYERIIEILGGGSNSTVGPHLQPGGRRPVPRPGPCQHP